jgi:hypothetical protein
MASRRTSQTLRGLASKNARTGGPELAGASALGAYQRESPIWTKSPVEPPFPHA